MPHYDYSCTACGFELEQFQGIKDDPLSQCPKCFKETLKRGIGGGGALFQFKGKGFYLTDYGKEPKTAKSCDCSGKHSCG